MSNWICLSLRVVQTQSILFLKLMSERVGSDIERLWNWISRSTQNYLKMTPFKLRVVPCRNRLFPTLISKIKWLESELPLSWQWPHKTLVFIKTKRYWTKCRFKSSSGRLKYIFYLRSLRRRFKRAWTESRKWGLIDSTMLFCFGWERWTLLK